MKIIKFTLTVLILFTLVFTTSAQFPIEITEKTVTMSKGEQPAFIVKIPQANAEDVIKPWKKLIRQNTKSKVSENNDEIVILNTRINRISDSLINIYSAVYGVDSAVKLVALFEIDSSFFSFDGNKRNVDNEKTYQGIKHFLYDFAVEEYKKAVEQELEQENKELKNLNSELDKLLKQTESFNKKVKHNENDSINAETQINSLEADKNRKQGEIDNKKESMASIGGDKELLDQAKKSLKSLEKQRKKIEKEIEKLKDNIVEYRMDNIELKRKIEENNKQKEELLNKINEQKETIKKITEKYNNIK